MTDPKHWYWHISIDTTRIALERLGRALLSTCATLEPPRWIPGYPLGRGVSAHLVVGLAEGRQDDFRHIMDQSLISMGPPPRATVGTDAPEPDGHPGRAE